MHGGTEIGRDSKMTNIAKSYKILEVVEIHDHSHHERTWHVEVDEECVHSSLSQTVMMTNVNFSKRCHFLIGSVLY